MYWKKSQYLFMTNSTLAPVSLRPHTRRTSRSSVMTHSNARSAGPKQTQEWWSVRLGARGRGRSTLTKCREGVVGLVCAVQGRVICGGGVGGEYAWPCSVKASGRDQSAHIVATSSMYSCAAASDIMATFVQLEESWLSIRPSMEEVRGIGVEPALTSRAAAKYGHG